MVRPLLLSLGLSVATTIPLRAGAECFSGRRGTAAFAGAQRISMISAGENDLTWHEIDAPFDSSAKAVKIRALESADGDTSILWSSETESRVLLPDLHHEYLLDIRPNRESILTFPRVVPGAHNFVIAFTPDGYVLALDVTANHQSDSSYVFTTSLVVEEGAGSALQVVATADADVNESEVAAMPACRFGDAMALVVEQSGTAVAMCDGQILEVGAQGFELTVPTPRPPSSGLHYVALSGVRDASGDAAFFGVLTDSASLTQIERITRADAGWASDVIAPLEQVTDLMNVDLVAATSQSVVFASRVESRGPWLVRAVFGDTGTWTVEEVVSTDEPLLDAIGNPPQILTGEMSLVYHHRETGEWSSQKIATIGWDSGLCDDICGCHADRRGTSITWLALLLLGCFHARQYRRRG